MRLNIRRGGFSLIEAAVAVGVLALGCLAAAGALHTAFRAEAAAQQGREAGRLLDAEAARLTALTFYRQGNGPGEGPPSLLGEVFPHARPELNVGPDGFMDESGAATFISEMPFEGSVVRRTATLVRVTDAATTPLSAAEVRGWAIWEDARPPALAVELRLELAGRPGPAAERRFVLHALRPSLDGAVACRAHPVASSTRLDSGPAAGAGVEGAVS